MVLFNYSTKELTAKIVYYGPGLCGKTSNLQYIHGNLPGNVKGKMLSLATKTDRTLFFDFLPIDLGEIRGMKTRVQLYTVPGQVFYNETRKLVLKGADGIVFVADSQEQMLSANAESFKNLEENLRGHGLSLGEMPHVIQFNKRDLPKLASIEQLNSTVNKYNAPFYESVATTGIGVQDTLKAITKLVLLHLTRKYDPRAGAAAEAPAARAPQAPAPPAMQPPAPGPAETQAIPLASLQPEPAAPPAPAIALSSDPLPQPRPERPAMAATVEPPAPTPSASPEFDDSEIDELVGEVEQLEDDSATMAFQAPDISESPFQIDDTNIAREQAVPAAPELTAPEPDDEPVLETASPAFEMPQDEPFTDLPEEPVALEPEPSFDAAAFDEPALEPAATVDAPEERFADEDSAATDDEVLLTDVATDDDLFTDPSFEIAGVAPGEQREIVIPLELGEEGRKRRFTLSVRLKLDPVD